MRVGVKLRKNASGSSGLGRHLLGALELPLFAGRRAQMVAQPESQPEPQPDSAASKSNSKGPTAAELLKRAASRRPDPDQQDGNAADGAGANDYGSDAFESDSADPIDPGSGGDEEQFYLDMLNRVVRIVGLQAQVTSFAECAQASIFVAILEKMHEVQLSGVIRKPETYEDRVHNCTNVIEALGGIDIAAGRVCQGDFRAIADLITVFNDLCPLASSLAMRELDGHQVHHHHQHGRPASRGPADDEQAAAQWWGQGSGPFTDDRAPLPPALYTYLHGASPPTIFRRPPHRSRAAQPALSVLVLWLAGCRR